MTNSTPSDSTELPAEVTARPLALVAVSGLDTVNNAVHRAVWEALSSRRVDRAPLRFKLLPNTFELPVVKPKRSSYEWYMPKGILKRNWIPKRLSLIPAVIVVFYDMEWDDPQWNEKIIECASRVQSIRAACEGHNTRAAVVVLQSAPAPPPTEYPLGAERAQALCAACEIQSKALFVLPHGAHLAGYAARLEAALCDLAHGYYHHEARAVRSHRDLLNKTTHQYLLVRHQFKLGFLNELKQDLSAAHKHYLHAYTSLLETRTVDTNVHEVRTVAGFVNYKLCRLLFALNLPRDAITQHRTHMERYRSRTGPTELLFEHYAWLARQHAAFGELFDEAVRGGLPATRSQHPGFYYQQAAALTGSRRQAMRAVCVHPVPYPPSPDPLAGPLEYYGQRAWRPGRLNADPHDPSKEAAAIQAMQNLECTFNHSALIISYLGAAIAQFKMFHSPRMRKQLVVEMADEYFYSADYGKALTLLAHMLWEYRKERWWILASHVLTRALQCAYLAAKLVDYLQLAVEALSPHIRVPGGDRDRVYRNITALLQCEPPEAEPDVSPHAVGPARELWASVAARDPLTVTVDMTTISSFLQVKPMFTQHTYSMDETVLVELYVRLAYSTRLRVHGALVTVATRTDTTDIAVTAGDDAATGFLLEGNKVHKLVCQFNPNHADSGTDLHIKNVSFLLDSDSRRKLVLNFKMDDNKETSSVAHPELLHFMQSPKAQHEFDSLVPLTASTLTARQCRLSLDTHNACPALQGEWFVTTFTVTNDEHSALSDLTMTVSLLPSADNPDPEAVTELGLCSGRDAPTPHAHPLALTVSHLHSKAQSVHSFYLKTNRIATVTVQIKVSYNINLTTAGNIQCVKEFITNIPVHKPFEVAATCVATNFTPITCCFVNSPFIVMPHITILSPCDLIIEDTELEVTECFRHADVAPVSCIRGLRVGRSSVASDAVCIEARYQPQPRERGPVRVGLYNITWRRADASHSLPVRSTAALAGVSVVACGVSARVLCPAAVTLLTPMGVTCELHGTGSRAVRLAVTMEGTDAFMFAGYKRAQVTVAPGAMVRLHYSLQPLLVGSAAPPRITATLLDTDADTPGEQEALTDMFDRIFPHRIFVMPKDNK